MSYSTSLIGELKFDRKITPTRAATLAALASERQDETETPGYYCPWEVNADGTGIGWEGGEGRRDYVEWLRFLIEKYFTPWGMTINGRADWEGDENSDMGQIHVTDNVVTVKKAVITFEEETS